MNKKVYTALKDIFGSRLIKNKLLSEETTFGIGGPAGLFLVAQAPDEIVMTIKIAAEYGIRYFILGGGSNILCSDEGFNGIVIKNSLKAQPRVDGKCITIETGHPLETLVELSISRGLSGFEYLAGIPGTVGGAIKGNAGAFGKATGDKLVSATIVNKHGEILTVERDYFDFDYRHSKISISGDAILEATFELEEEDPSKLRRIADDIIQERRKKHPPAEIKCAGSFFKNLPPAEPGGKRIAAGLYLDKAGAKGMKVNDAEVWEGHANFLINRGKASAKDVLELSTKLKQLVKEKFDINLEEEVVFIS